MTMPPDRRVLKAQAREQLKKARVSPLKMTALYSAVNLALAALVNAVTQPELLETFVTVLAYLSAWVLQAGFVLYFMELRRGQRAGFGILLDGFNFAGKVIALNIVMLFFVTVWSFLLVIPGFVALYRYRFALYYLYEDPGMDIMEALRRSCRRTEGFKRALFLLDLRYFGWRLLERLPTLMVMWIGVREAEGSLPGAVLSAASGTSASLWLPLYFLSGLWSVAVQVMYLPEYQWMQLSYFDLAREEREAAL